MSVPVRSAETLMDFYEYCRTHPTERFWQALRNWAGAGGWLVFTNDWGTAKSGNDTFYWEGKNK
jgi:hypothetical protein